MSLSSAMMVGFSGIKSNTVMVSTVGDNLANVNTTAFKGQRTLFETLLYTTIREGEAPGDTSGGTLPFQIGSGSTVATVQRSFAQGSLQGTAFPGDLAVDGDGFFILDRGDGQQVYTRDGSFRLDANQTLVSSNGAAVQVFASNDAGTIDTGTLSNLVIPLGTAGRASATSEVVMEGRLNAGTSIASQAAVVTSQPMVTSNGTAATASTPLTDLVSVDGIPLFATDDVLRVRAEKGGLAMQESAFVVGTTGSTLGDFARHLETVLGINTDPAAGGTPGVRIADGTDGPAGALVITSNPGEINAVSLNEASVANTTGVATAPFSFATTTEAIGGGGTTTSFEVFDSLGNPVDVRFRLALESKSENGTTWRFYAESVEDTDLSPVLGTGTISFDPNGQLVGATGLDITINRDGTGAATTLTFTLDFSRLTGLAAADGSSELIMSRQDGVPAGVLVGYSIDESGIVTGTFSNQQVEVLGQVALATFTNNEGLVAVSENTFVPGVNSGDPVVVAPLASNAGAIRSGTLEESNVEIAREFLNLITASTGISVAGRVVRVADDLLQELLLLAR